LVKFENNINYTKDNQYQVFQYATLT